MEEQTETQEQVQNQEATSKEIPNRRERRGRLKEQGILKYLSKLNFLNPIRANFRAETMKNGKRIQEIRLANIEAEWAETLGDKLENMKETWYEIGYNADEIAMLEEAATIGFVKNKETYREDKNEAKSLMKKAKESLLSRKTK
jgi:hypothetical protein